MCVEACGKKMASTAIPPVICNYNCSPARSKNGGWGLWLRWNERAESQPWEFRGGKWCSFGWLCECGYVYKRCHLFPSLLSHNTSQHVLVWNILYSFVALVLNCLSECRSIWSLRVTLLVITYNKGYHKDLYSDRCTYTICTMRKYS